MADIYVRTDGDDGTGDGSTGNPYATLDKAFDEVSASDTIILGDGTYTTNINSTGYLLLSGLPAGVTIRSETAVTSIWQTKPVTIVNASGDRVYGINGAFGNTVTFRGIKFQMPGSQAYLFYAQNSGTVIHQFCEIELNIATTTRPMWKRANSGSGGLQFEDCLFVIRHAVNAPFLRLEAGSQVFTRCVSIGNLSAASTNAFVEIGANCAGLTLTDVTINTNVCGVRQMTLTGSTALSVSFTNLNVICRGAGSATRAVFFAGAAGSTTYTVAVNGLRIESDHLAANFGGGLLNTSEFKNVQIIAGLAEAAVGATGLGFGDDGTRIVSTGVRLENIHVISKSGHALLLGTFTNGFVVHNVCADASEGIDHALVTKGLNHQFTGRTLLIGGGTVSNNGSSLFLKGCQNCDFFDLTLFQETNTQQGVIMFTTDDDANLQAGDGVLNDADERLVANNRIRRLRVTNTAAPLFTIPAGSFAVGDDANEIDDNIYEVSGTGTWGSISGTSVNSLATARSALASAGFDGADAASTVEFPGALVSDGGNVFAIAGSAPGYY